MTLTLSEASAPTVKVVDTTEDYGKFAIEPLEPGFGTTLGNSLRRVLLSSLSGAAVTSVSIDGVAHEFSSIPHVREDVTEILLNLKGLNLISHTDEPVRLSLEVKGPKQVTAGDIKTPSDVEVVNTDLYICSIDDASTTLRAELVVERGKGYVPADKNKKEDQPIGVIPIDAIFSPVVKANFLVEKTRVGQETDWDKLVLEVWTDRTIKPEDAVSEAARIFTRHLDLFSRFGESILAAPVAGAPATGPAGKLADTPVEELELSVRALNCLKANDITRIGQLLGKREDELLSLRNFGKKSLDEIKEKLVEKGYVPADEIDSAFA